MGGGIKRFKEYWRNVKTSRGFHNALVFLSFVAVSALFWFVLAMNDNVTKTFDVGLKIVNVPDSVTFITDPPSAIHVTLRDKGTNIFRSAMMNHRNIYINFRDFASGNSFRFTKNDMNAALKSTFGSTAQIGSVSLDSLSLSYTTGKGIRVPIVVRTDISASPGNVIAGLPEPMERVARVYSLSDEIDTLSHVYTEPIVKRNLSETTEFNVRLVSVKGAKVVPSRIKVRIPVEPLVKKEAMASVKALNVPTGTSLLLFPAKVPVSYYVPMSLFNSEQVPVDVTVDYEDTKKSNVNRLPLILQSTEEYVVNPQLEQADIEYTLVKE